MICQVTAFQLATGCEVRHRRLPQDKVWTSQSFENIEPKSVALGSDVVAAVAQVVALQDFHQKQKFQMTNKQLLQVFLCHSSQDKPKVRGLYKRLQEFGVEPWLDEENLLPGQKWELEIPKAVKSEERKGKETLHSWNICKYLDVTRYQYHSDI